jgi:hypothetical protein
MNNFPSLPPFQRPLDIFPHPHITSPMLVPLFFMLGLAAAFNNPPGVDIWCGKAYRATYVIANRKLRG